MPLPDSVPDADAVDLLITEQGGDVRAALESVLHEVEALRQELRFASLAMSFGFARGWQPKSLP